jgi:hypothetical protein
MYIFIKFSYNEHIGRYFFIARCSTIFANELPELLGKQHPSRGTILCTSGLTSLHSSHVVGEYYTIVVTWILSFIICVSPLSYTFLVWDEALHYTTDLVWPTLSILDRVDAFASIRWQPKMVAWDTCCSSTNHGGLLTEHKTSKCLPFTIKYWV